MYKHGAESVECKRRKIVNKTCHRWNVKFRIRGRTSQVLFIALLTRMAHFISILSEIEPYSSCYPVYVGALRARSNFNKILVTIDLFILMCCHHIYYYIYIYSNIFKKKQSSNISLSLEDCSGWISWILYTLQESIILKHQLRLIKV